MIKAVIVTNLKEGISEKKICEYLQNIQHVVGMHNMCVSKAIIERSNGVNPFLCEALDVIDNVICTEDCNAIVLDDSFGYEESETYAVIKEVADSRNTPIYHYKDNKLFMSDINEDFEFDAVPFEVIEMRFDCRESDFGMSEESLEVIKEVCESFEERLNCLSTNQKIEEVLLFAQGLVEVTSSYIEKSKEINKKLEEETSDSRKKNKKK